MEGSPYIVDANVDLDDEGKEAGDAKDEVNDTGTFQGTGILTTQMIDSQVAMDVDGSSRPSKPKLGRKRIEKRKHRKTKVVFQKYSDRMGQKKKTAK